MGRISSRNGVIRCRRPSQIHSLSPIWPMPCTRHLSLQCYPGPLASWVDAGNRLPQVSQGTETPSQRCPSQRGLNQQGPDPGKSALSTSQEPGSTGPSTPLANQQVQDPTPEASDTDSSKTGECTPEEEWPHWGSKVKVTH